MKDDKNKLQWTLLPWIALAPVVKVLMFGAKKYGRENWKTVSSDRYANALVRHITAFLSGEFYDKETDLPHLAHAVCNCLFILYKNLSDKG